jgi:N-acetylmuramoyl-L-alanine amidase
MYIHHRGNRQLRRMIVASAFIALSAPAAAEEIGQCRFDRDTLTFAGTPAEQATCLMRKVELLGELESQPLPPVLHTLLESGGAPALAEKAAAIAAFPEPYRAYANEHAGRPISQTAAGLPALYFVIHDTSTPFYGEERFPKHLDRDHRINDFTPYMDGTFAQHPVAHIFLSRYGQIWAGHDFSEGWRATKLESYVVGPAARGRFVHVELIQPRRFLPGFSDRGHTQGPKPGFSDAQYRQLAALYVYASARAGRWLIPAQHATLDAGIPDAHDDPQSFELEKFAAALEALLSAAP